MSETHPVSREGADRSGTGPGVCQRCDKPLTGRQAKWCSNNCLKRASDDRNRATCTDCGGHLGPRSGWAQDGRDALRCRVCDDAHRAAEHEARVQRVASLYNAGASYAAIGDALGYRASTQPGMLLREARERGLIGYRYTGCERRAA